MQLLDDGKHLLVYSNGMKAYNDIPTDYNYSVEWENPMGGGVGFYLSRKNVFNKPTFKTYGAQLDVVDDVIDAFKASDHSVGVILSGAKGSGKTVFSKMLSIKARDLNMPTILVNDNNKGVTSFLSKIDKPACILFDEFEKKFKDTMQNDGNVDSQNDLLSLFDGVLGSKNIYILTVNDIVELSPYLLNRPGRFMYAIRMKQPNPNDINEYLNDKLGKNVANRKNQIKDIIQFSFKFPLSYDILNSIVFQLNLGHEFKKILPSLNLMNFSDSDYNLEIEFESGYVYALRDINIDLFSEVIKVSSADIRFDFLSKKLSVANNYLQVNGNNINRLSVDGSLKDKVQSGLHPENINSIKIVPNRTDDFSFNM